MPGRMFREAVIAARDARGWTDRQLSIAAGVSYSRLHEWLSDTAKPKGITSETLEKVAAALDLVFGPRGKIRSPRKPPKPRKK